jgi:small subunit ribosomal protein S4
MPQAKAPVTKGTTPATPQQKQSRGRQRKITQYGSQLLEKQNLRNAYGMREAQFRRVYEFAAKFRGQTGTILLQMLERRLDNVLFRAGLAKTRSQARQLASHRHIKLNGARVSIASITVKKGDIIEPYKMTAIEILKEVKAPDWLKVDHKTGKTEVTRLPESDELPIEFDTQKVIEFYSK